MEKGVCAGKEYSDGSTVRGKVHLIGVFIVSVSRVHMLLRSFNPALSSHFKQFPKAQFQYGFKNISTPLGCQKIIDRLDLKSKYPNSKGNLDIVDVFAGFGLFSTMVNYELQPRNHLVIEHHQENANIWRHRLEFLKRTTGNKERFIFSDLDGYSWQTYDTLIKEQGLINPPFRDRKNVHDELLVLGNLTPLKNGESFFAQWLMCSAFQNWLQKYGRVRMVVFTGDTVAQKFFAGPHFRKRNRTSLKRDLFTESTLIGVPGSAGADSSSSSDGFDPRTLVTDQPSPINSASVSPSGAQLCVVEVVPRDTPDIDVNEIDFLTQILLFRQSGCVRDALLILAAGALEDFAPRMTPELLNKRFRDLTREDLYFLYNLYHNWAFKPRFEETISFFVDETRNV